VPGIFLSYARETKSAAETLSQDMKKLGYATWFDEDLNGGKAWWDQILAQIRECEIFVMALSPGSLDSEACGRECGYAEALGKPILPIMVADGVGVLPPRLSKIQYVDYRKRDVDSYADLVNALKGAPSAAALPQPLPDPPAIPMSYLESIAGQIDSAAPLSIKDQSDIVSQLRSGLDDPESAAGARELLVRFSKKPDLYARTAREIDALLRSSLPPAGRLPPPPDDTLPPPPGDVRPADPPRSHTEHSAWPSRLAVGGAGAIIGAALAAGIFAVEAAHDAFVLAIVPAIAGAVAGAISGMNARVIGFALLGGFVTWLAGLPFVDELAGGPEFSYFWSVAAAFTVPPGIILGAILGAVMRRARKWP
jgi:hypothetical protein